MIFANELQILSPVSGGGFEADDGGDEGEDEEEAPEGGGLVEEDDAEGDCADGSDAGPHGVGGADWQLLGGFGKQSHADDCKHEESGDPAPPCGAVDSFCSSEAVGEADLAGAGCNQNYPVHNCIRTCFEGCKQNSRRLLLRQRKGTKKE